MMDIHVAAGSREFNKSNVRPAEPLLASQLIGDEELDELVEGVCSIGTRITRRNESTLLITGVKSVDDALEGGLESGKLVSISSEAGSGGSELCRTLLVDSLFKNENSTAAVIDTSGNFDIMRLYTLILSFLKRNHEALSSLRSHDAPSNSGAKIEDVAAEVLDRVKIMRVFDFVGVREAVGEIRDMLEGKSALTTSKEGKEVKKHVVDEEEQLVNKTPPKRTVVLDSEDEEEDEEMLFDAEATVTKPTPAPAVQDRGLEQQPRLSHTELDQEQTISEEDRGKVKFILIDNLAAVINPLLKKDYIQTNALASTFLTTLTHLTRTHNLSTILLNPTTTPRPSTLPPSLARHLPQNAGQVAPPAPPAPPPKQPPQPPSIFASSTAVPNLMNVLGRHVDVGLLVTRVPRRKLDARVFYSDVGGSTKGSIVVRKGKGPEMVGVVEVVSDRWEGRVGAWGTFEESEESGMVDLL